MIQLVAFIIFIISIGTVSVIVYRKIPQLVSLPQNGHHGLKKPRVVAKLEKKLKETHFHWFKKQMFLHKILSKTKVWILKMETKIDHLLHGIKKKSQELEKKTRRKK